MQATGWKRRTGQAAIPRFKNTGKCLGRDSSLPDFNQGPADGPYHVLKETITSNPKYPRRVGPVPTRLENDAGPVLNLCCRRTKRSEIVRSQEVSSTPV